MSVTPIAFAIIDDSLLISLRVLVTLGIQLMRAVILVSVNLSQDLAIRRLPLLSSCLMSWNQVLFLFA